MTLSMLFRAVGDVGVAPGFASSMPPVNDFVNITTNEPQVSMSVFTAEMFFTAIMVLSMLVAR